MHSFGEILALWTIKELSEVLDCPYPTAAGIKRRGIVGINHWPRLIEAARQKGVDLDAEMLMRMRVARSASSQAAD